MTDELRKQHEESISKGLRASRFIDSDFFQKDFLPYLKDREKALQVASTQDPSAILQSQVHGIVEKIAVTACLNSGQLNFMQAMLSEIDGWITLGEEKTKLLEDVYEKK